MNFSDDWKSLWPISSAYAPPLLLSNSEKEQEPSSKRRRTDSPIGPLLFKPTAETKTLLFFSPLLSPRLPPPIPEVTLPSFLKTLSGTTSSLSGYLSKQFGPQVSGSTHNFNAIQLLPCPSFSEANKPNSILGLFPTGENYDQIGYFILEYNNDNDKEPVLKRFKNGEAFLVHNRKLHCRILRLYGNPVVSGFDKSFGYLLVCTLYSVHWYSAKMMGTSVVLDYVGGAERNLFKGCSICHACWSPHLSEECVVLLENGDMFLFDMGSSRGLFGRGMMQGKKLLVSWDKLDVDGEWVSCEFSWHPRILIVAHSSAVFLADLRSDKCKVCTMLKIEAVTLGRTDRCLGLSRVESDPFCFTAVTRRFLFLCDIRKPLMPLLRWIHGLNNPGYVTVLRLSDMRPSSSDCKWARATDTGSCILVGSFWDCEFALFCYGPGNCDCPEISRLSKTVYAWGQPSGLSLSGRDCYCGNCLLRANFSKDILLDWIGWRQKKVIVLGFGILKNALSSAGFMLVRLMSCGRLEAQRYTASLDSEERSAPLDSEEKSASLDSEERSESLHGRKLPCADNNLLYDRCIKEKLDKTNHYLDFGFLKAYLDGKLTKILSRKLIENQKDSEEIWAEFHQQICDKLKECGIRRLRSPQTVFDVIKEISLPASLYEITTENICASLPNNLLVLAFYALLTFPEVTLKPKKGLKLSDILDKLYPLPFPLHKCCIDEEGQSPSPSSAPILPPPFMVALNNLQIAQRDIFPLDTELRLQSDKVMKAAHEIGLPHSGTKLGNDYAVPLDADTEFPCDVIEKKISLCLHEPVAYSDCHISKVDSDGVEPDKRFTTFIYKKRQEPISDGSKKTTAAELFDKGCPIKLRFNDSSIMLGNEHDFKLLKQKFVNFRKSFQPYQEYLRGFHMSQ